MMLPVPQCCPPLCWPVVPVFWRASCPEELVCASPWWYHSRDTGDIEHKVMGITSSATTPPQPQPLPQGWHRHGGSSPALAFP